MSNLTNDYRDYCINRIFAVCCNRDPFVERKLCKDIICNLSRNDIIKMYKSVMVGESEWYKNRKVEEVF